MWDLRLNWWQASLLAVYIIWVFTVESAKEHPFRFILGVLICLLLLCTIGLAVYGLIHLLSFVHIQISLG